MKQILLACMMSLIALASAPGASLSTPVGLPEEFALPVNHRILRVTGGNGFAFGTDASGNIAYRNGYIIDDGMIVQDIPAALRSWYREHHVVDLYVSTAGMVRESAPSTSPDVLIETRIATFPDEQDAEHAVMHHVNLRRGSTRDLSPMRNLPQSGEVIIGMIGRGQHDDPIRGEGRRFSMSFVRLVALHGSMAVSVKVAGPEQAFSEEVAKELLAAQLACLDATTPCLPIPIPDGTRLPPETPEGSPVALTPDRPRSSVRFRA